LNKTTFTRLIYYKFSIIESQQLFIHISENVLIDYHIEKPSLQFRKILILRN